MKRKDTSKLLKEWKSFLNENQEDQIDQEFIQNTPRLPDDRSMNDSMESIKASLFDLGLKEEDIDSTLEQIKMLSPKSVEELDDEFNEEALSSLEDDEHLSER